MRVRRPGEIDYYEELGVDRNAAPEEIRDSFRALARLLHPDHQQDEHLKTTADRQLRRVNRIYAVLSDPERRRRYDELLDEDFRPSPVVYNPPANNFTAGQMVSRFVWIGGAVVAAAVLIWLATDQPPVTPYSPDRGAVFAGPVPPPPASGSTSESAASQSALPQQPRSGPASDSQGEIEQLKAELRLTRAERDQATQELLHLKGDERTAVPASIPQTAPPSASANIADLAPPRIVPQSPQPPRTGVTASINPALRNLKPPAPDPHQFAGFWYFTPTAGQRQKNLYPPEFIEATLTEQNGVVHGRYRSRYRIVDRAISPDVNFEFSGTPNGLTMVCTWLGAGGAKGTIALRMTDDNDLRVDWSASQIGRVQGLASGTAMLTRRVE